MKSAPEIEIEHPSAPSRPLEPAQRFSYIFMLVLLAIAGWLHVAGLLVSALFAYLALHRLHFARRRWLTVLMFVVLLGAGGYALGLFVKQTIRELPEIAEVAIPSIIETARKYQVELPFTDYDSFRERAMEGVKSQVSYLAGFARFARGAGRELLMILAGCVIAAGFFLHPHLEARTPLGLPRRSLWQACADAVVQRFTVLYQSFAMVLGAQIIISAINTVFTTIFVLATHLPHATIVIGVTFLCGLIPVIGNLISNTIIVSIGLTISPKMAIACLVYLVVIHKLEYFLNSKIVGDRINFPLWATLTAIVLGERLMGIPGMILAPVILNYVRMEAHALPAPGSASSPDPDSAKS